nr:MAG TPA: triphosphate pyrophosphohydrolase [Caudoviricetes sp.]
MKNTMEAKHKELIGNLQMELSNWFMKTHCRDDQGKDSQLSKDYEILYSKCIAEEFKEFLKERSGTPNEMKELCDLIWVCVQYANACGYDLEKGMNELVSEYSSKFYDSEGNYNPQFREDGKLLKGTGFKKANFEQFFDEE